MPSMALQVIGYRYEIIVSLLPLLLLDGTSHGVRQFRVWQFKSPETKQLAKVKVE